MNGEPNSVKNRPLHLKINNDHVCEPIGLPDINFEICSICHAYVSMDNKSSSDQVRGIKSLAFTKNVDRGIHPLHVLKELLATQHKNRKFSVTLMDFKLRPEIIKWMKSRSLDYQINSETLHLSVAIFDVMVSKFVIPEDGLELLAYLSISLASMSGYLENIITLTSILKEFSETLKLKNLFEWQKCISQGLDWYFCIKTPYVFLSFFFSIGILFNYEVEDSQLAGHEFAHFVQETSEQILEISLNCYSLYQYTSLDVAASAISISREKHGLQSWNQELARITGRNLNEFSNCLSIINKLVDECEESQGCSSENKCLVSPFLSLNQHSIASAHQTFLKPKNLINLNTPVRNESQLRPVCARQTASEHNRNLKKSNEKKSRIKKKRTKRFQKEKLGKNAKLESSSESIPHLESDNPNKMGFDHNYFSSFKSLEKP